MKKSKLIKNVISPLFTYGLLLIFSLITSRTVLIGYGSETNGLISSVNQIFNYLALLEAGIGTATTQALYTSIGKSKDKTQNVLAASQSYFRSSARIYIICVIVVSFLWPVLIDSSIPYWTIWGLVFFQGISSVISFWYASTITCYLAVIGSNYINNNVHFCTNILSYLLKLLICVSGLNITYISISLVLVNIGKCVFLRLYMKRIFPEFFTIRKAERQLLKQRNAFLIHEISGVIFYSTDTIIISIFCGLTEASIYAVYSLILSALRNIIGQVFSGTKYVLGNKYAKDRDNYLVVHDTYNSIYILGSFAIYTVTFLLMIPFVSLYTKGVSDARYIQPVLPLLFVLIDMLSACRIVNGEVIRFSYHAKNTISRTVIEAALNLTVSLVCVQFWGLYGVLVGTIVALVYRSNDIILYTNHRILQRSAKKEYIRCLINFSVFAIFIWAANWIRPNVQNFAELIGSAIVTFVVVTAIYTVVNMMTCRELKDLLRKVIKNLAREC